MGWLSLNEVKLRQQITRCMRFATLTQIAPLRSANFRYPPTVRRNAVPKKDKKDGREKLKTEKFRNKYRLSCAWQTIPD